MKKLLLALLLAGILSACAAKTDTPQTESEPQSDTQSDTQSETQSDTPQESEAEISPADRRIFDPYWQLSDGDPFLFAMRDNPIDAIEPEIMKDRYKTGDMADGMYIIYDLWVAEMEHSLQELLDAIEDDGLKQELLDSQTAWEANVDAAQHVNNRLITQDGENYGTIMLVLMPSARVGAYRERTILLKYLLYLYADGFYTGTIPQFLPVEA